MTVNSLPSQRSGAAHHTHVVENVSPYHLKRFFDVMTASLGLLCLAPLFLVLSVVVKLDTKGPVLFRQTRCGRDGQPFTIVKLRTMVHDAEERRHELNDLNEGAGPLFKICNDPRVTRSGRWLRKFSLDELPQLWNVLLGHMSFVGPRPALPQEVAAYEPAAVRRLVLRPGITGLWQINGRSDLTWTEGVRLDLHYIDHQSLALDLVILARTIPNVLSSHGAY